MSNEQWKQTLLKQYNDRNQKHKMAAFEMEKQEAKRENRPPHIWSPEQVPGLVQPAQGLPAGPGRLAFRTMQAEVRLDRPWPFAAVCVMVMRA